MERRGSATEKQYRVVDPFHRPREDGGAAAFVSNAIRTSKYTYLNFLPLCLLQEFQRSANLYFLVIAILQSIKEISPLTPVTAIAPLVMVVSVSLLREAVEDSRKRASDRSINAKAVTVGRHFTQQRVTWEAIQVGDIVRVGEKEAIPADGILLCSSEDDGSCFIDTSNLDGEANLKSREALRATLGLSLDACALDGPHFFLRCEQPDQDLYRFAGNLCVGDKRFSLSEAQFLPRGATLMNTKWVQLLVVYTGHDTKVMKNARAAHHKLSRLETLTSRTVVVVFVLEVLLCAVAAGIHHWRFHEALFGWELEGTQELDTLLLFLSFVVLLNTLIPISLVVTVEIIKTVHAQFITWDAAMRNAAGHGALANTASLTDELGQVKYIFTDKTGTLTQNRMEFRKCSVGGAVYVAAPRPVVLGALSMSSMDVPTGAQTATFRCESADAGGPRTVSYFRGLLPNLETCESRLALAMAVCHTVVCEQDVVSGATAYNSDSPDECALVRGAEGMGVKLLERSGPRVYVALSEEARDKSHLKTVTYTLSFEVLRVLHFSSDRKRMSVVVRDEDGRLKVLCKGADSVILERCDRFLSDRAATMTHLTQFAEEGFRILLFAERTLDEGYFAAWEARYNEAELDMQAKGPKTEALVDELERKLALIGASAVEDKLQEGVPETISLFQKAGIKIWVLTGDKLETSLEMGKLCRVVTPGMREVVLRGTTRDAFTLQLDTALAEATDNQALVMDGCALTWALRPCNRDKFLQLALRSTTVIVSRTSPIQKALVVELVKSGVPYVTLAVGDGANDVSMIRAAHVGIGVAGQEGMQAIRSADYAVQQFSHLGRLLLHHGRLSYIRTSQCINYFFYKNIVFTLPQFLFGAVSGYSAQTFFCDLYITAYNVIFTALPVIVRAVMETDVPERLAAKFPELYRLGAADAGLSAATLTRSAALAVFHALVATAIPILLLHYDADGHTSAGGFWITSVTSFFYIVPIVHLQIFWETWNWTCVVSATYAASLLGFLICIAVYDRFVSDVQGVWSAAVSKPSFWLGFFLAVVTCLAPNVAYKCHEENFVAMNPVHILRRLRLQSNKVFSSSQADTATVPHPQRAGITSVVPQPQPPKPR